jgi:hypothetical protein
MNLMYAFSVCCCVLAFDALFAVDCHTLLRSCFSTVGAKRLVMEYTLVGLNHSIHRYQRIYVQVQMQLLD